MDMATMVTMEICLLIGGILGFFLALAVYDNSLIQRNGNRLKKTPRKQADEPTEKKTKKEIKSFTLQKPENDDSDDTSGVDIFSKIPNKDATWSQTTCDFDGSDEKTEISKHRAKEDSAYSILQRKMKNSQKDKET